MIPIAFIIQFWSTDIKMIDILRYYERECFNHCRDLSSNSIKIKEDLGTSKPKKYPNQIKMVLAQTVNI